MRDSDQDLRARRVHNGLVVLLAQVQQMRRKLGRTPPTDLIWLDQELAQLEEGIRTVYGIHGTFWEITTEDR